LYDFLCTIHVDFIYIYMYNIGMKTSQNIAQLMDLAASQWSLFTSAQAVALGASRTLLTRMAEDGRIERMARGVWRVTSAPEVQDLAIKAAWLSLSPKETAWDRLRKRPYDAVATGRTAAVLLGDAELHPEPYTFAVGRGRRTARDDVRLCAWEVDESDVVLTGGLPTARLERTISDLVRLREDPSLVDGFAKGAASRGMTVDGGRLAELLAPLAARNGYAKDDGVAYARDIIERDVLPTKSAQVVEQLKEISDNVGSLAAKTIPSVLQALSTIAEAVEQMKSSLPNPEQSTEAPEPVMETTRAVIDTTDAMEKQGREVTA
jgi:hypothetical protein